MVKKYDIHDNGGRPFHVEIQENTVKVWKNMDTYVIINKKFIDIQKPPKQIFTITPTKIFIGKKSPDGGYDGLKPSQAEGNSILLFVKPNKYRYIGTEIYDFLTVKGDTIEKYYSNIGNNDVPYPYAVGKTHIYIMIDKVAVEKTYFDMKKDIYDQYYFGHDIHMCLKGNPKSDICKDPKVYKPRLRELEDKTVSLITKQVEKRIF
jgi:hypothetical protein